MGTLVSCANGSGTSLMVMWDVEKAMKGLGVSITKIHHCAISRGKSSVSQHGVAFAPVNSSQMFQQAEKRGVIVTGIRSVVPAKETQEKYMASDRYQKPE